MLQHWAAYFNGKTYAEQVSLSGTENKAARGSASPAAA